MVLPMLSVYKSAASSGIASLKQLQISTVTPDTAKKIQQKHVLAKKYRLFSFSEPISDPKPQDTVHSNAPPRLQTILLLFRPPEHHCHLLSSLPVSMKVLVVVAVLLALVAIAQGTVFYL